MMNGKEPCGGDIHGSTRFFVSLRMTCIGNPSPSRPCPICVIGRPSFFTLGFGESPFPTSGDGKDKLPCGDEDWSAFGFDHMLNGI